MSSEKTMQQSATPPAAADAERVLARLRHIIDPEVGVNIVDLGLVYGIDAGPDVLRIFLTMTSPACPMGEMIRDEVRGALRGEVGPGGTIDVCLVWEPPWSPAMMNEAARKALGWHD